MNSAYIAIWNVLKPFKPRKKQELAEQIVNTQLEVQAEHRNHG